MTKPKPKPPAAPPAAPAASPTTTAPAAARSTKAALPVGELKRVRALKVGIDHLSVRRRVGDVFDLPVDAKTGELASWVEEVGDEVPAGAAKDVAPTAGSGAAASDGSVI